MFGMALTRPSLTMQ